jgi:divalent metal cation (Fe/Co/Zn/Cd) transporter
MTIEPGHTFHLTEAIEAVEHVRSVTAIDVIDRGDAGIIVVARVGLSPVLRLPEVVILIDEISTAVRKVEPSVTEVFVEPDIASDSATPTEAIVIRALD